MRDEVKMLVGVAMVVVVAEMGPVVDGNTRKLLIKDNGNNKDDNDVHHVDNFFGGTGYPGTGFGGTGTGSAIFPNPGAGFGGTGTGSSILPNPGAGFGGTGTGSGIFPNPGIGVGGVGVPGIGSVEFCSFPGLGCVHVDPTNPTGGGTSGGLGGLGGLGGISPPLPFP